MPSDPSWYQEHLLPGGEFSIYRSASGKGERARAPRVMNWPEDDWSFMRPIAERVIAASSRTPGFDRTITLQDHLNHLMGKWHVRRCYGLLDNVENFDGDQRDDGEDVPIGLDVKTCRVTGRNRHAAGWTCSKAQWNGIGEGKKKTRAFICVAIDQQEGSTTVVGWAPVEFDARVGARTIYPDGPNSWTVMPNRGPVKLIEPVTTDPWLPPRWWRLNIEPAMAEAAA